MNLPLIVGVAYVAALTGMALSSCIESPKEYTLGLPVPIFAMTAIPFVLGYMTGKSNS